MISLDQRILLQESLASPWKLHLRLRCKCSLDFIIVLRVSANAVLAIVIEAILDVVSGDLSNPLHSVFNLQLASQLIIN